MEQTSHSNTTITLTSIMKPLSSADKALIISVISAGLSFCQISSRSGHGLATISRIGPKHFPDLKKAVGGRPSKLSTSDICYATHLIHSKKAENAVEVTRQLRDITNQPLSPETTRRALKKAGLKAVVKKKKPLLSLRHRRSRLDFALQYQYWTMEDWKRVIFSDETKINRLGSDGRKWAWKFAGEGLTDRLVEPTLKFGGGSVMVWGCMSWKGRGEACKIDSRMDGDLYVKILEENLQESIRSLNKPNSEIIFQQDNDPKHTCKKAKAWFNAHNIQVLSWPAQSPDLNPIEHLWQHLQKQLAGHPTPPSGMEELWERIQEEWFKIPESYCQELVESIPRRVKAVIRANGGYTKY